MNVRQPPLSLSLALLPLSWAAAAPRVDSTVPPDGATGVDPRTAEIVVVFSDEMDWRSGYSIMGGGPTFPEVVGAPRWRDAKTLSLPVKLEPGRDYALAFNGDGERFQKFRSSAGHALAPTPLRFRTAAVAPPADPLGALRELLPHRYSHAASCGIDWEAFHRRAAGRLQPLVERPGEFAAALAEMLGEARDIHLWLSVEGREGVVGTHALEGEPNIDPAALKDEVPGLRRSNASVLVGDFPGGPAYVALLTFRAEAKADVAAAVEHLRALEVERPLILDLRLNSGGSEHLAREVAGLFVTAPTPYAKHEGLRPEGGFGAMQTRTVGPDAGGHLHRGPVAVLCGPGNVSSAEAFLLMMRASGATLIGAKTAGASGNPVAHPLGNGVELHLPSWRAYDLGGVPLERRGIAPDLEVGGADEVIPAALRHLREGR